MLTEELDEMVVEESSDVIIEANEEDGENPEDENSEEEIDVVTIEGESPPEQVEEETQRAPEWVREVRKKNRSLTDENRKLKAELERAKTVPNAEASTLPKKPTLEDFDYESEEYEKALEEWQSKKLEHDHKQREIERKNQEQAQRVMEGYAQSKQKLKVQDFDIAEDTVVDKLPIELQNVILAVADNPAAVVYALGKNKAKLEELAKIDNPFVFAKELGKMEGKIKIEQRKMPPPPERAVKGSANGSGIDSTLESLRKEAEKSGDYSKVMAYKNQQKQRGN